MSVTATVTPLPTATRRIRRLLVANRGEIAARIIRTAADLGIETVAVFSDPDRPSIAVREATLAVHLPGQTSAETYLRADLILDAARRTGADAIHPGYGFLSENPGFARAVVEAGLIWVGPDPEQIEAMALKVEAKRLAAAAGVPLVPGAELANDADDAAITAAGAAVGFPLLVKASAGGGGKGMRLVPQAAELIESVAAARREATSAFGDGTVFLERYLTGARHVEVQVFGDRHGHTVHLFERECSIQRRHQKVVEETPSPGTTDATRARMFEAAVSLASAIGYVGAGTVEFMVAGSGAAQEFFFLEMNTRLQVEHPVTEETTGVDLVEWQLRVAQGEPLPLAQHEIEQIGHAIEVRLYAEDPANGYLPNTGRLELARLWADPFIRVDTGVESGSEITSMYDPMLAKIIASGGTRAETARTLAAYLDDLRLVGPRTNRASLAALLREPDFLLGATTTDYLDLHPQVLAPELAPDVHRRAVVAAVVAAAARQRLDDPAAHLAPPGWRNVPAVVEFARVHVDRGGAETALVRWHRHGDTLAVELCPDENPFTAHAVDSFDARVDVLGVERGQPATAGSPARSEPDVVQIALEIDGVLRHHEVELIAGVALVGAAGVSVPVRLLPRFVDSSLGSGAAGPSTPVPGTVTVVSVQAGDEVEPGQTLVVLEAMKMEHRITADAAGVVEQVLVQVGQSVDAHQVVVVLAAEPATDEGA